MYDSEDSTDKYQTLKISIGGMIKKNADMLQFVPSHLNTIKICKQAVKKFLL